MLVLFGVEALDAEVALEPLDLVEVDHSVGCLHEVCDEPADVAVPLRGKVILTKNPIQVDRGLLAVLLGTRFEPANHDWDVSLGHGLRLFVEHRYPPSRRLLEVVLAILVFF